MRHEPSGDTLKTDAPKDNQGRGESFSPTDLIASALGACEVPGLEVRARPRKDDSAEVYLADEFIGTPLYLAPEVFQSAQFDHTVDFYALGVCAMEMLLGRAPVEEVAEYLATLARLGVLEEVRR